MDSVTGTRHADLSELADKRGTIEGHLSSYAEIDEHTRESLMHVVERSIPPSASSPS